MSKIPLSRRVRGKDLGQGKFIIRLSGNNIAFMKEIDGKSHIIFNGKDMGEGKFIRLSGDNIAFGREIDGKSYIIFNGQDLGIGQNPILSKPIQ